MMRGRAVRYREVPGTRWPNHRDAMGINKHVPLSPSGATHKIEDIVFSLVREARKFLEARQKPGGPQ